jgi:predicted RNase H-like HicB family nuclease
MVSNAPPSWRAVIYRDEDGAWCAEVPALPGCVSAGDTRDEAIANIREAVDLWLETRRELGWAIPAADSGAEVVEIQVI